MKLLKQLAIAAIALLSTTLQAGTTGIIRPNYTLDVYQTKHLTAAGIDQKYHQELSQIADMILKTSSMPTEENSKRLLSKLGSLLEALKSSGDYAYLGLSPVIYPGDTKIGFSVDVVDKNDAARVLNFLPNQMHRCQTRVA